MEYEIRRAEVGDAAGIRDVAANVRFQPGVADGSQGFLVYLGTVAEYEARLGQSAGSMVAVDGEGRIAAFLLTVEGGAVAAKAGATPVEALLDALTEGPEGLVLIDQIGVRRDAAGSGLAQRMMDAMLAVVRPSRMVASIMHGPVRNERSIRFFTLKNGFRYVGSMREEEFEWGTYVWSRV